MRKKALNAIWSIVLIASIAVYTAAAANAASAFYVSGRTLYDANGNKFVAQGVANPDIWFISPALAAVPTIASKKANIVRIVWETSGSASDLSNAIAAVVNNGMVANVELHDYTGSDNAGNLVSAANYYTSSSILPVLKQYQKYLLLEIANEWSDGNESTYSWEQAYEPAITELRNAGITTTIVVDNPGYAQNYEGGVQYGQALENYDPQHNLLFSVHMYAGFNNSSSITTCDSDYYNANLPLIIGEFGYDDNNGDNNLGDTENYALVMSSALNNGYGYIAWSTYGNDSADAWLNLFESDWATTTWWGNEVFYNYSYSIANSAQKASIFSSGSQTIANGTYKIINRLSGLALDAYGDGTSDGTVVDQWSYGGGNNQRWNVSYLGNGEYTLTNVNANLVLDASGYGPSGSWADLWSLTGGSNQQWIIISEGSGYYRVSPVYNSGLALDNYEASTSDYNTSTNYGRIDVYDWTGGSNQEWAFDSP